MFWFCDVFCLSTLVFMFQVKMFWIEVTETVTRSSSTKQGVFKKFILS